MTNENISFGTFDLARRNARARAIIKCIPKEHKMYRDSEVVASCRQSIKDVPYDVQSLARVFGEWRRRYVRALAFKDCRTSERYFLEVEGWEEALCGVMHYMAETRRELVTALDEARLLPWIQKTNPRMPMVDCWLPGDYVVHLGCESDISRLMQWLFVMCEIRLEDVAVCYARGNHLPCQYRRIRCKRPEKLVIPLCKHEEKKKSKKARHWHPAVVKKERLSAGGCSRRQNGVTRIDYSTPPPSGYLISPDGVVIGRSSSRRYDEQREPSITRSGSDSEDTWKSFGHMARDNGRYGAINGEDYAD